jgi:hypothetical protein
MAQAPAAACSAALRTSRSPPSPYEGNYDLFIGSFQEKEQRTTSFSKKVPIVTL